MEKIAIIPAPGLGDALILQIAAHHLSLAGYDVQLATAHRFGRWLPYAKYGEDLIVDAVFLQHDNSAKAEKIRLSHPKVYTFYGSHKASKHAELKSGFDYVCDLNRTMVDNVVLALQMLFGIQASSDNGLIPPSGLIHRKYAKRVAIHTTSADPRRNWPLSRFKEVSNWLKTKGMEPAILPQFSSLEELICFIYESGYFLGNDSGPGHIASCLKIPHLVIGRDERHMRHWRPGWGYGEIAVPPRWVPNWKGFRLREKEWKRFITSKSVINKLKKIILSN